MSTGKPPPREHHGDRFFARETGAGGARPPQTVGELWQNYLEGGYFTAEGHLRRDYVDRDRVEPLVKAMSRGQPELTQHQLRRFFQHCRALEARLRARQATWQALEADFCKLDAASADAYGKSPPKIPPLFYDFIRRNVTAVRSERDFLAGFLPHFEALVGFASLHLKKSERN
jgi:CRISPR type III-A-associated protein Csm2